MLSVLQITGAAIGALLQALLVDEVRLGAKTGPGCVADTGTLTQLVGWELLFTMLLVAATLNKHNGAWAAGGAQLMAMLIGMDRLVCVAACTDALHMTGFPTTPNPQVAPRRAQSSTQLVCWPLRSRFCALRPVYGHTLPPMLLPPCWWLLWCC